MSSTARVCASRTVTIRRSSSAAPLSVSVTAFQRAAPTVASQRWSRRSIVPVSAPRLRLVQGAVPVGVDRVHLAGVASAMTHVPSNVAP